MKKLIWKLDLLVYRLFYWRWLPRLKRDPALVYMFSEMITAWNAANPPRDTKAIKAVDEILRAERERIQHNQICLDKTHWH